MRRIAFTMELRPEVDAADYKRRHDDIWPDMLAALRAAGMTNYSIYLHQHTLFAYLEVDDFECMVRTISADPVNERWQQSMAPFIEVNTDPATGFALLLPEMFHLD